MPECADSCASVWFVLLVLVCIELLSWWLPAPPTTTESLSSSRSPQHWTHTHIKEYTCKKVDQKYLPPDVGQ